MYSAGAYVSGDLDFVPDAMFSSDMADPMSEIGFYKKGRHDRIERWCESESPRGDAAFRELRRRATERGP